MEGIHRRALQKGYKNLHRGPGKSVHTGAIGDEKQSTESSVGNKATGIDELPIELIKATGETALTALRQHIWESNVWPQE